MRHEILRPDEIGRLPQAQGVESLRSLRLLSVFDLCVVSEWRERRTRFVECHLTGWRCMRRSFILVKYQIPDILVCDLLPTKFMPSLLNTRVAPLIIRT